MLVWSTAPQEGIRVVSFSEVGAGNGDYIISQNPSPNGRVYEWISPDPVTGLRRGNFAPIIPLLAPQQKQMVTAGGELRVGKRGQLSGEVGISRHDLNRFSSMDDNDNTGAALKFNFSTPLQIGPKWIVTPFGGYEGNGDNFRTLDPYRNPEFARDWNLTGIQMPTSEQLPTLGLRVGRSQKIFSQYKYEGLFRENSYNGNRHTAQLLYDTLGWKVDVIMGLLDAKSSLYNTRFLRPVINLERVVIKKGNWRLGWSYFEDRNETRDKVSDTLSPVSFIQDKMSFYMKNDPEANTYLYGGYSRETPKIPKGNQFDILEKAAEWNVGGHFHKWKDFKLGYTIKQRDVESFNPQNPERSSNLLGRLDVKADLIKKAFKWTAGYEIGNGQEPKVEYKYVKVQKGEGIYTWVDDGDGVEELNEFEQAPFADQGEYIRLSVFNNDFVRTRALNLQQTMYIYLKNLVTMCLLPNITALSTYQLSRKIREDMDSPFWNPFYRQYADTSVLANSSTWRNILYWNRSSPKYDIQLGYVKQDNQVLQTSGFEIRESDDLTLRSRINLQKKMDMVLNLRNGIKENRSQNFTSRNYKIRQLEVGPELNVIL